MFPGSETTQNCMLNHVLKHWRQGFILKFEKIGEGYHSHCYGNVCCLETLRIISVVVCDDLCENDVLFTTFGSGSF